MNYPMRQQTPNGWQVAGQALQGAGETVGQFSDKQAQMRALFQQMVEKRQAAILAQKQQEQEMEFKKAEDARQEAKAGREATAEENRRKFQEGIQGKVISATLTKDPSLAKSSKPVVPGGPTQAELDDLGNVEGMQIPNQAIGAQDSTAMMGQALDRQPTDMGNGRAEPTRDEILRSGLQYGQMDEAKKYADATKPEKDMEGERAFKWAMNEYNQGRMDRRTLMTIGGAMDRAEMSDKSKPKGHGGMPVAPLGDTETKSIKDIRRTASLLSRIGDAADNISNLKRGPIAGLVAGKNPYDADIAKLEKLVNQTIPSMARGVFGEVGVLTDDDVNRYKDMFATIKTNPGVANELMADLRSTIQDSWYQTIDTYEKGNKNVSGFDPHWTFDQIAEIAAQRAAGVAPRTLDDAVQQSVDGIKEGSEIRLTGDKAKRLAELRAKAAQGTIK